MKKHMLLILMVLCAYNVNCYTKEQENYRKKIDNYAAFDDASIGEMLDDDTYSFRNSPEFSHVDEAQCHFNEKIKNYFDLIKQEAVYLSREYVDVHQAIHLFDAIEYDRTPSALLSKLAHIEQLTSHQQEQGGFSPKLYEQALYGDKSIQEKVQCALLISLVVKISTFVRNRLVTILDILDSHDMYWHQQYSRPIHYFLHKSPHKWFVGKNQTEEITANIKHIEQLQTNYYVLFGSFEKHLNAFIVNNTLENHYAWIQKFVELTEKIFDIEPVKVDVDSAHVQLSVRLEQILTVMGMYQNNVYEKIGSAGIPHYFIRHWIAYATLATAVGAGLYYAKKNPEKMKNYIEQLKSAKDNFFNNNIKGPWETVKNYFGKAFGTSEIEININVDDVKDSIQKIKNLLSTSESGQENKNMPTLGSEKERLKKLYQEFIYSYFKYRNRPTDESIADRIENLDLDYLSAILDDFANAWKESYVWSKSDLSSWLAPILNLYSQVALHKSKMLGNNLAQPITKLVEIFVNQGSALLTQADKALVKNNLTIAMAAFSPVVILGAGTWSVLKKCGSRLMPRKYSFESMHNALHEIYALLNVHTHTAIAMDDETEGKISFYMQKVKREGRHYVAQKNKRHFLHDLNRLELPHLTAKQKIRIIDNMRHTFDFLQPGFIYRRSA